MADQIETPYVPSDKLIAEIRTRVTGTCSCCGYDKHDFETADVLTLMDEVDRARTALAEMQAKITVELGTDWGSGRDESWAKSCGNLGDAHDYARAYEERVFTRELYAGPWMPVVGDDDD